MRYGYILYPMAELLAERTPDSRTGLEEGVVGVHACVRVFEGAPVSSALLSVFLSAIMGAAVLVYCISSDPL